MSSKSSVVHSGTWERVKSGIVVGAAIGGLLLLIGIVRAVIAVIGGQQVTADGLRDLGLALVYVAAFAMAGGVVGAFWPLRRTRPGAYFLGYLGAGIVCTACGVIVMQLEHDRDPRKFLAVVGITTVIFGT